MKNGGFQYLSRIRNGNQKAKAGIHRFMTIIWIPDLGFAGNGSFLENYVKKSRIS